MLYKWFAAVIIIISTSACAIYSKSANDPVLKESASPVDLDGVKAKFYKDISYGSSPGNTLDIFLPESGSLSSLVIYIHGGGFTNGDKTMAYDKGQGGDHIKTYLKKNIAYASLNYRLLKPGNTEGVLLSLNDSKRALQYIRYYAKTFNIDKNKIVLSGGSAGAGTCLWIAFNDDMADKKNADPVLRESTRVNGAILTNPQATYDLPSWSDKVFKEYQAKGFTQQSLTSIVKNESIAAFFGLDVSKPIDFNSPEVKNYGKKVDMLALMSADDPEIYVETGGIPYEIPKSTVAVNHHPLHAKALMEEARKKNYKAKFSIGQLNINTTSGESKQDFVIRLIGNN